MDKNYNEWIQNLKQRVLQVQLKAVVSVNSELLRFYWNLGLGFAYMGRQFKLEVGNRDFYIDLLFYHVKLHCYVVIELQIGELEPEHIGKLNFYIAAVDEQLKQQLPDNLKSRLSAIEEIESEFAGELGGVDER